MLLYIVLKFKWMRHLFQEKWAIALYNSSNIHQTFDTFHRKTLQTQKLLQNPEKSTLLLLFYFISILISQKPNPKNYPRVRTPHWWNDFPIFCDLGELNRRPSFCTSPPFFFTFTWPHVINVPLQSQLLSPTEGFPPRRHWLLCVWNRRGQHSCAQAPNEGTNSCRNNPDSHWECKPIRCSEVAASLKVDNQCLCEAIWCQQAEKVHPAAFQSCCLSCADGLPCRGNGDGLFWMDHHRQCWIITAKYDVFSSWIIDGQNLLFWTGYWPG